VHVPTEKTPPHLSSTEIKLRLAKDESPQELRTEFRISRVKAPTPVPHYDKQPTQANARDHVLAHLRKGEKYDKDRHPFPVYRRAAIPDLETFVDIHAWTKADKNDPDSDLVGHRIEYELRVPIFHPVTNLLLHNRILRSAEFEGPPEEHSLDETNPALFWNQ